VTEAIPRIGAAPKGAPSRHAFCRSRAVDTSTAGALVQAPTHLPKGPRQQRSAAVRPFRAPRAEGP